MAIYKYEKYLSKGSSEEFDKLYSPGAIPSYPGIYRCEECGHEITSNVGNKLPPQNHHQHKPSQGPILWRLIVWG